MTWIAPDVERSENYPENRNEPEREMLRDWLDWHRATLSSKCAGLERTQLAVRAVPPSSLSLLGLVRHMSDTERGWVRQTFRGPPELRRAPLHERVTTEFMGIRDMPSLGVHKQHSRWPISCARSPLLGGHRHDAIACGMHRPTTRLPKEVFMSAGFSRRAFLGSGASLAGAGWVGAQASRAAAATGPSGTREPLAMRRSTFLPLLGQSFRMARGGESLTVVLRKVMDLKPATRPGAEDQFSLIFSHSRLRPAVQQGTYSISHPRRGRISLFVVPVGRRQYVQQYQVIIDNRPLRLFHQG